nr:MAG TPA: hypothetical protein [Caudoviricetes sp.]DAY37545.1 MAG TPA: hypothetical protein [Caudoviricetes sp.]
MIFFVNLHYLFERGGSSSLGYIDIRMLFFSDLSLS